MTILSRRRMLAMSLAAGTAFALARRARAATSPDERLRLDWPNLARYREENSALIASSDPVNVVFMGDSITEGWLAKAPGFFSRGRICRGISGQTTPQMVLRFHQDVIRLKPRIVHIMAGTNDIAGNTGPSTSEMSQDNLMAMIEMARAHQVRIILASITPASDFPWRPGIETAGPIIALNDWLKACAVRLGAQYADYHAALSDGKGAMRAGFSYDHVHPTAEGYAVMRPVADAAIAAATRGPGGSSNC